MANKTSELVQSMIKDYEASKRRVNINYYHFYIISKFSLISCICSPNTLTEFVSERECMRKYETGENNWYTIFCFFVFCFLFFVFCFLFLFFVFCFLFFVFCFLFFVFCFFFFFLTFALFRCDYKKWIMRMISRKNLAR